MTISIPALRETIANIIVKSGLRERVGPDAYPLAQRIAENIIDRLGIEMVFAEQQFPTHMLDNANSLMAIREVMARALARAIEDNIIKSITLEMGKNRRNLTTKAEARAFIITEVSDE